MHIVPGGCHRLAVSVSGAIWTMRGDGTDLVELVVASDAEAPHRYRSIDDVSWSPDGKRIAYSLSYGSVGGHKRAQIWVISSDGSEQVLVIDSGDQASVLLTQITWSPDGSHLYYIFECCASLSHGRPATLQKMNVDGTNRTHLADARNYSWSPDGSQIVYEKLVKRVLSNDEPYWTGQMWVMDKDGRNHSKIRDDGASFGPLWSPDGSRIAIEIASRSADDDLYKELSVFNSKGRFRRLLDYIPYEYTHPNDFRDTGFSWSPNGDQIAYLDYQGDDDVLALVGVDGSGKQILTSLGRAATFPVWSPDGTRIAFAPGTSSPYKDGVQVSGGGLWIINPDGTNLLRLTPEHWYISDIAWSPKR